MMKVLFVGLGSIGSRHIKNLCMIAQKESLPLQITALRSSGRELPPDVSCLIDRQLATLDDECYDLAFVTNPTQLHAEILCQLRGKVRHFFIEKPIFADCTLRPQDIGLTAENAYVAAPMRFTAVYQALQAQLANTGMPYSTRVICSSYLPDWRPKQDYRRVYSALKEMGGGVEIDLIHELDYVTALFGQPLACHSFRGKYSHLEIDSNDLSVYILRYASQLCEVHLDYFGREYRRTCECFVREGTMIADFGGCKLTLPDGGAIECAEPVNMRYEREMAYFLHFAAQQEININPPETAYQTLALALEE